MVVEVMYRAPSRRPKSRWCAGARKTGASSFPRVDSHATRLYLSILVECLEEDHTSGEHARQEGWLLWVFFETPVLALVGTELLLGTIDFSRVVELKVELQLLLKVVKVFDVFCFFPSALVVV